MQMIDLMLQAAGEELGGFDPKGLALAVEGADDDPLRSVGNAVIWNGPGGKTWLFYVVRLKVAHRKMAIAKAEKTEAAEGDAAAVAGATPAAGAKGAAPAAGAKGAAPAAKGRDSSPQPSSASR